MLDFILELSWSPYKYGGMKANAPKWCCWKVIKAAVRAWVHAHRLWRAIGQPGVIRALPRVELVENEKRDGLEPDPKGVTNEMQ